MSKTLYDKLWEKHEVCQREDGTFLLYIDRHLIHEVTSPQAFEGLKLAGRKPWRISANIATPDHNVPTTERAEGINGIKDEVAKLQVLTLDANCEENKIFGRPLGTFVSWSLYFLKPPGASKTQRGLRLFLMKQIPKFVNRTPQG